MAHYWIFVTFTWFGTVSLQYINTAGADGETLMDPLDSTIHFPPLPYVNYFNQHRNDFEGLQNDDNIEHDDFYPRDQDQPEVPRKRRTADDKQEESKDTQWKPNLVDVDKTLYLRNEDKASPFVFHGYAKKLARNSTEFINSIEKRSFSPWGGKRDAAMEHNTWTWKRSAAMREPSMPKRVRFSPWGGKRSGQMIYKPGARASKVIFSANVPELTRIVSNYSPKGRLDLEGFQYVPFLDKRHPIKILALSTQLDEKTAKDALPFNTFMESLPKSFKLGHPYFDINLKKDGKRKVKFSAWGGKRSPPIIGPIWTPAPQNVKDSTLDTIVLIRNHENDDPSKLF